MTITTESSQEEMDEALDHVLQQMHILINNTFENVEFGELECTLIIFPKLKPDTPMMISTETDPVNIQVLRQVMALIAEDSPNLKPN